MARYNSVLETIGATPVIRINHLAPEGINLFVKAEAFNPMGSVKDRLALGVIEAAERDGSLKPGQTVVEASSGNTGIGLAMVCAAKGYPLVITMAESFSVERRKLMRFLGAKVVLTPASEKGTGMLYKAIELAETHGWFLTRQFDNEANADIHSATTAPEIIADFEGERLDYWVTGFGTAGTLKGVSRILRKSRPETKIFVCEPDNSQMLSTGIGQERDDTGMPTKSHPGFRPHLMQGWSPDFIPKLAQDVLDAAVIDRYLPINGNDAMDYSRQLARHEGIFTGVSGGATFAGAMAVASQADKGTTILAMLPDTGERYLSTPLFADIPEEMTDEEFEISRSTPRYRFDAPAPPSRKETEKEEPTPAPPEPVDPQAADEVAAIIADADSPVVMFAHEWCEFCWSVRNMFAEAQIPYRSIDLDSAAYQEGNLGRKLRVALCDRTGIQTIPQIFIGGDLIGGCTETFDAFKDGSLASKLVALNVDYDRAFAKDPYTFLPKWLHPR